MTKKKKYKRSTNSFKNAVTSTNLYFTIYSLIEQGKSPSQICHELGINKQRVSYYMKGLKACGAVSKIGYGVWKAHGINKLRSTNIALRPSRQFIRESKKEVRGHAFRFLVKLPVIEKWKKRHEFLQKKGIEFKKIPYGESIEVRGHRVKLFNRSLDIYFSKSWSYFGESSEVVFQYAILELNQILTAFENMFKIDFGPKRKWKISRQHYSLVKNALAKDYLLKKEKLQVYNQDGSLWFIIDNSYQLEEAETCHTQDARTDSRKVQDFFNGVKETGITPEQIYKHIEQTHNNFEHIDKGFEQIDKDREYQNEVMQFYATNIKSHIGVMQSIGEAMYALRDEIKDFKKTIRKK